MSLVRTHRIRQGIFTMYLKRMNFPGGGCYTDYVCTPFLHNVKHPQTSCIAAEYFVHVY